MKLDEMRGRARVEEPGQVEPAKKDWFEATA